jgi:hypothetical protein
MTNDNHELFIKHLENAKPTEKFAATLLYEQGHEVRLGSYTIAPTASEHKKHLDEGDIFIRLHGEGEEKRIEVKGTSYNFRKKEDWNWNSFIVYGKEAFDRAEGSIYCIMRFSADLGAVALVFPEDTKDSWYVDLVPDPRYKGNYKQLCYLCPVDLVIWKEL